MDDGTLWAPAVGMLRDRVTQLGQVLRRYGLRLNLSKCQLYCSPTCPGPHLMEVAGETLTASECLDVMGIKLRVGADHLRISFAARFKGQGKILGGETHTPDQGEHQSKNPDDGQGDQRYRVVVYWVFRPGQKPR